MLAVIYILVSDHRYYLLLCIDHSIIHMLPMFLWLPSLAFMPFVIEVDPIDDSSHNASYICLVFSSHVYMIVLTGLYIFQCCQHCFICLVIFPSYTSSCTYMYDCNHIFVKVIFFSDYIHLLMRFLCQHSTLSTQAVGNGNVFSGLALLFCRSRLGQVYLWTEIGWFFMITFHFWYSIRASIPIRCMLLCLALQVSVHSYLMFLWLPLLGFIPFVLLLLHVVA